MNILNPRLYEALQLKYGDVGIVNHGQAARVSCQPYYGSSGKPRMSPEVDGGEKYKVRCQFCHDHSQRLIFNHCWGTRDKRTKQLLLHPVHCFNEPCVDSIDVQKQLHANIFSRRAQRRLRESGAVPAPVQSQKPVSQRKISLPRGLVSVHTLASEHPARLYLEQRDFDVEELRRLWRVSYCERDIRPSTTVLNRLVIPIYDRDVLAQNSSVKKKWKLVGWQARSVTPGPGSTGAPKYYTAPGYQKSAHLYGLPHALRDNDPVVLVEGVTDVWRLGRNAVATLGKTLSHRQEQQMVGLFRGRPIVVANDSDATEQSQQACARLREARRTISDDALVTIATLPENRQDIGECTREEAWEIVERAR